MEQIRIMECGEPYAALGYLFPGEAKGRYRLVEKLRPLVGSKSFLYLRVGKDTRMAFCGGEVDVTINSQVIVGAEAFLQKMGRCKGIMIWIDDGRLDEGSAWAKKLTDCLKKNCGVWILERKNTYREREKVERMALMAKWGLVQRKAVSKRGTSFCYWYGRRKNDGRHGQEYDLTTRYSFQKALRGMIKGYWENGWLRVNPDEAVRACQHSRMPFLREGPVPVVMVKTELGMGVELTAPCGCRWEMTNKGDEVRLWQCENGCEGIPGEAAQAFTEADYLNSRNPMNILGYGIPSSELGRTMWCGNCREEILVDRIVEKLFSKGGVEMAQILINCRCPHHGLISGGEWRREVPARNLLVYQGKGVLPKYRKHELVK